MSLASVWAWLSAHAVLVLLAWPIFSALVNLAFGAAEKWAVTHPRFGAVLGVIESAGFDARGTLAWVAKLLAGKSGVGVEVGKKISTVLVMLAFASHLVACISSAPIVPETPANQAQIASCQNTASTHNGLVIGDFTVGGLGAASGIVGAAVTDSGQKTAFSTGAAVAGGVAGVLTALVSYTAANFANSKCPDVVGPLPSTPFGNKAAGGFH